MDTVVRVIKLPSRVKGITVPDADGSFNIYINKDLSYEMQLKALRHEMHHVNNDDFYSNESVATIEDRMPYEIK